MCKVVRKGGLGLTSPLSLICYKSFITCAKEIIYVFVYFWVFIANLTQISQNENLMKILMNIVNGTKRNN